MFQRGGGVLMHISSLPGAYGIGTFGKEAFAFIDLLAQAGCRYWQVLPFGPTDAFHSPYASISAFAGNMNFIDLAQLGADGLLTDQELVESQYANPYTAAFEFLDATKLNTLYRAYTRLSQTQREAVAAFSAANQDWLPDYTLYTVLKESHCGKEWYDWPAELKFREPEALRRETEKNRDTLAFLAFVQYTFYTQWQRVKAYAAEKHVRIIGDLPIYIAMESPDVWSHRDLFDLNEEGRPVNVAGVPPDYFSADGQKWGQALYRWDRMQADGYGWWMRRLKASFDLFDQVRIDHFRAFSSYWAVPEAAPTAKEGVWMPGPGRAFFDEAFRRFGSERIIAEDLGLIDEGVHTLLRETGLPGMRILQFGFLDPSDNLHLPHNHPENAVAYTGTHDNNTSLGWLWEAAPEVRQWALAYSGFTGSDWAEGGFESGSCRALIRTLWQSPARVAMVPIQDLCGFGSDTKMNLPGVPHGNWAFRISREQLERIDWDWLKRLNGTYCRG